MTFESYNKELISESIWWEQIQLKHGKKDLMGLSRECYIWLLTQPERWKKQDYNDFRRAYQKFLIYAADMTEVQERQYEKAQPVEIHPQALTGEQREARLKEWQTEVNKIGQPEKIKGSRVFHVAQQIKKPDSVYHPPTKEEVYKADRHFAWVKHCFDSKTGEPNENFVPETEFDLLYDAGLL